MVDRVCAYSMEIVLCSAVEKGACSRYTYYATSTLPTTIYRTSYTWARTSLCSQQHTHKHGIAINYARLFIVIVRNQKFRASLLSVRCLTLAPLCRHAVFLTNERTPHTALSASERAHAIICVHRDLMMFECVPWVRLCVLMSISTYSAFLSHSHR